MTSTIIDTLSPHLNEIQDRLITLKANFLTDEIFRRQVVGVVIGIALLYAILHVRSNRRDKPLPPGPKPQWIVGNARQLPHSLQWVHFAKWSEKYGPFFTFRVFGTRFLVLNDGESAFDLLDKRSLIYSDRPPSVMSELIGWDFNMTLYPYGAAWKAHRKAMTQALSVTASMDYREMQYEETVKFLHKLTSAPNNFSTLIEHLTGATIMRLTYGYELKHNDGYIPLVKAAVHALTQSQGVGFLVDQITILRYVPSWFPGAKFQRLAKEWRVPTRGILEIPFAAMKKRWMLGGAPLSYCSRLLDDNENRNGGSPEQEQIIKETSAVLYAAGTDSTTALIHSFFLVCTLYPEMQKRAQAEIDEVVGTDRLPEFSDRPNLKYVDCLLKEIFRWNPAAPLCPTHMILQDDEYKGYLIPAGTIVMPNIWAMLHDPKLYPDPLTFNPDRFWNLSESEMAEKDPRNFMFGFGRRVCVGQYLADAALYLAITSLLATFSASKAKDANGKEIIPEVSYTGFVGHPKPFQCVVKPRSKKAVSVIQDAYNNIEPSQ